MISNITSDLANILNLLLNTYDHVLVRGVLYCTNTIAKNVCIFLSLIFCN